MSTFSLAGGTPLVRAAAASQPLGTSFEPVLVAAQAGAEWAWTSLYRTVAPSVRGYLAANGSDDPDNLLGEVFLQLARHIATFSGDESDFRGWVFTIARNRLRDEHRRRRRRPVELVADVPEVAGRDDVSGGLLTQEALALLDSLTPEQRDVILLRVFADLSLEEVARIVGRPVGAVKALQHRGLTALRKKLSDDPYPDEPVWR